jgi:16S rRNA G966 N2-methylase RsmD
MRKAGGGAKTAKKRSGAAGAAEVKITAAKGRPMLHWVGKRPLSRITAFPAQHIETFPGPAPSQGWDDWPAAYPKGGLLFHGDNKEVVANLIANGFRGKVKLVYIDPPFDSGADYVRKVRLRTGTQGAARFDAEGHSLGEQVQYSDWWANDNYLQVMYERLLLLRELLSDDGSIALHCDARRSHYLRMLMEEVYGADNFRGEIVVRAGVKNVQSQFEEMSNLSLGSNTVFLYSKGAETKYRKLQLVGQDDEPGKWDTFWRGTERATMRYELFGQTPDDGQWRWKPARALAAVENYRRYEEEFAGSMSLDDYYLQELGYGEDLDFVRLSEDGTVQYYVPPRSYRLLSSVWFDLRYRGTQTDYPTEKHGSIAKRLVEWVTVPGDLVLDCFIGSGTVAVVAQELGRRWIGCDINKGAVQTTSKRLQTIMAEQAGANQQRQLEEIEDAAKPAQLSFTVWRVNDYELQIQHNEAVQLACDHIGIERTRSDRSFDGALGDRLVKIVPFAHPLSPMDLEAISAELHARPEEDRGIVVVCLGKELAADAWLDDWNRLRRGRNAVNRIEVIELRTDPRHGGFLTHEPAQAKVSIIRRADQIEVQIDDFISPTIIARLKQQSGILQPKIDDWRAMVDCVMIDPAYDGKVFCIALSDIPEKKTDLVCGTYTLPAPAGKTTVAVKIIDMLGEEVLVTTEV